MPTSLCVLVGTYVTDEKALFYVHHVVDSDLIVEDCATGLVAWWPLKKMAGLRSVEPLAEAVGL